MLDSGSQMGESGVGRSVLLALENRMTLAVGTCHSRAGGVNVEFNESSTATSGQDVALCGHQTARQYTILPPFQSFSLPLLWPHSLFGSLRNMVLCSLCSSWTLILPSLYGEEDISD